MACHCVEGIIGLKKKKKKRTLSQVCTQTSALNLPSNHTSLQTCSSAKQSKFPKKLTAYAWLMHRNKCSIMYLWMFKYIIVALETIMTKLLKQFARKDTNLVASHYFAANRISIWGYQTMSTWVEVVARGNAAIDH